MTAGNNTGMVVENPLELQLVFPDGLFLFEDENIVRESVSGTPEKTLTATEETISETAEVNDKTEVGEEASAAVIGEVGDHVVEPLPEQPLRESLQHPVRVCLDFSDPSLQPFGNIHDLLERMMSIVKWQDRTLSPEIVDFVDISLPGNSDSNWLFGHAGKGVVFGSADKFGAAGEPDYSVKQITACEVLFVPPIPAIMAGNEHKKRFAEHLKKFFSS